MAEKLPFVLKQFNKGWNTEVISDYLDPAESPDLENVDFSASGSIKKDWGFAEMSSDADTATSKELWVFPDRQGVEWLIKRNDTKLKIYDATLDRFDTIKTGLTSTANFAAEYFDTVAYFSSDVDNGFTLDFSKITRLDGAITSGDTTISLVNASAFPASGTVMIDGSAVTYSGKSSNDLTGCSGAPTSIDNSLVVLATATAASIPKSTITAIYAGRLFVALGSTVYGSKLVDLTNFTVAGAGTGDAIQKTLESKVNAIRVFYDDNNNLRLLAFAANNKIYVLDTIDDETLSSTITTSSRFKESTTALNQNTTVVGFNDMYHIDLENQVKSLGQKYANQGVNKIYSDSISGQHATLFKRYFDFSMGKGIIFNNELWITCAYNGSTVNNRLVIVDLTTGAWRQRTDINANWLEFYDNKLIWTDAADNKVYYLDEALRSADDDVIRFKYSTPDLDVEKLRFERLRRVRVSGFMSSDCISTVKVYKDFGTSLIGEFTLNGSDNNIMGSVLGSTAMFGSMIFGGEMAGGDGVSNIRFFIADLEMENLPDMENFRLVFENSQTNVYFEITAIKPFQFQMNDTYFPSKYILNTN